MVSSIHKFAQQLGSSHVVMGHAEKRRTEMLDNSADNELEYQQKRLERLKQDNAALHTAISTPFDPRKSNVTTDLEHGVNVGAPDHQKIMRRRSPITKRIKNFRRNQKQSKIQLLKEERDRFDAMRKIQRIGLLWCVGAIGFWKAEQHTQGLSYFQALYFCYVSLLTIGYGDLSPTSNAGKPFFIVWSLIAVPTMTILISDMGETVIASFKRGTFTLADWTVLPKAGVWRDFCEAHPWLLRWMQKRQIKEAEKEQARRIAEGFRAGPADEDVDVDVCGPTLDELAQQGPLDEPAMASKLALAIRRAANDLNSDPPKRYTYEEWADFTRLIRFTKLDQEELEEEEEDTGLVEWDWIGEDSPMLAQKSESEWILDRLCESLGRYMRRANFGQKQRGNVGLEQDKKVV
ncbi:uncharacterized protein KY384_007462 [Bacidia gigantensis]|uniref:uncharacterized protein n=1 Tax=Bacidia gigantensis TaxID=2732470 RepID=UPI001D0552C9|nr:uncharacterized protein KY384_007462 [Bacidia gigantensis]KAG8528544.1 hypothetical protein KY384_007462 [Bacidia gigantensis]